MILRRFTKHIKEQNWFAVGLDVIVVVVGIFLGMQVTEWNEERKEQAMESDYLIRFITDLETDLKLLDIAILLSESRQEMAQFLIDAAAEETLVHGKPVYFLKSIEQANYSYAPPPSNNSYQEITYSGRLDIISNQSLRTAILEYYGLIEEGKQWNTFWYHLQTEYQERKAGIMAPEQYIGFYDEEPEVNVEDALKVLNRLRENKKLLEWVPQIITHRKEILHDLRIQRTMAKELISSIRKFLH